jgi:hypothetical protein
MGDRREIAVATRLAPPHILRGDFSFRENAAHCNARCASDSRRRVAPGWRNGRRAGLKIPWPQGRAGSSPAPGMLHCNDLRHRDHSGRRSAGLPHGQCDLIFCPFPACLSSPRIAVVDHESTVGRERQVGRRVSQLRRHDRVGAVDSNGPDVAKLFEVDQQGVTRLPPGTDPRDSQKHGRRKLRRSE